jgi:nucleotide-binding universal stress UspA family protein
VFKKILLAYDGSDHTAAALRQSADLARLCNAELHLLGIVVTAGSVVVAEAYGAAYGGNDLFGQERKAIEDALSRATSELGEHISVHARIREGNPADEIAAYAHEAGADLAVIGHSGKGLLARWFEGSTGAKLIRDLPCNLLVATTA